MKSKIFLLLFLSTLCAAVLFCMTSCDCGGEEPEAVFFGEPTGVYTEKEIQEQIELALETGKRALTITGDYVISETVLLPSDFTLTLSDCSMTMADGVMVQMIRNSGYKMGEVNTLADQDNNINIIGQGRAVLDGGNYNGLSEKTSSKDGRPHVSNNHIILFSNVHEFAIKGLQIRNQRYWAMDFLYCSNGHISDIDFCSDDTYLDSKGNRHHGLERNNYDNVYVKNADGIDLRAGCHDFVIENITGFCEDDMIALTSLSGYVERTYRVTDAEKDIYNVEIRNVRGEGFCALVRLLNQASGTKLYNVTVDGVYDTSMGSTHMDHGLYSVRVGDTNAYGRGTMAEDSVYNVTIRNVSSRADYAVCLAGKMKDVTVENVTIFDRCKGRIKDLR